MLTLIWLGFGWICKYTFTKSTPALDWISYLQYVHTMPSLYLLNFKDDEEPQDFWDLWRNVGLYRLGIGLSFVVIVVFAIYSAQAWR
jgi:hypothetical protein